MMARADIAPEFPKRIAPLSGFSVLSYLASLIINDTNHSQLSCRRADQAPLKMVQGPRSDKRSTEHVSRA
jgi:hypothetical protein